MEYCTCGHAFGVHAGVQLACTRCVCNRFCKPFVLCRVLWHGWRLARR